MLRSRQESNETACWYYNLYSTSEHHNVEFVAAACGAAVKLS
jgi:hypothetical protein